MPDPTRDPDVILEVGGQLVFNAVALDAEEVSAEGLHFLGEEGSHDWLLDVIFFFVKLVFD